MHLPHCMSVHAGPVEDAVSSESFGSSSSAAIQTDRRSCNPCLLGLTVDGEVESVRFALAPRTLRGGKAGGVQPSMVAAALLGSSPFALLSQGWSGPSRYDRAYSASSASENNPCSRPSWDVCSSGTGVSSSRKLELLGLRPSGLAASEGSERKSAYNGGFLAVFRAISLPGEGAVKPEYPAMSIGAEKSESSGRCKSTLER